MNIPFEYDKLIHKGRVVELHTVGIKMPDGRVVARDLVRHPQAAVILPVLADGSVVMIRNRRYAVQEMLLELPAGGIDAGEDPAAGARRELLEETGYTAGKLELLGTYFSAPGSTDEVMHTFLATDLRAGEQQLEDYEEIRLEIVPLADIRRMILDGALHDGKSIIAMALYWLAKGGMA